MTTVLLAVIVALLARLVWLNERPRKKRTSKGDHLRAIVREAIEERLKHEQEEPHRYPPDQRFASVHMRARRLLHIGRHTHDDDELLLVLREELRGLR